MHTLWIGTAVTQSHLDRSKPYLDSLYKYGLNSYPDSANYKPYVIAVGFDPKAIAAYYPGMTTFSMPLSEVKCVDNNFYCAQYGCFLPYITHAVTPNDVVVLTDSSDMLIQRPLSIQEKERFMAYDESTIGLGYNADINDTFLAETRRLTTNLDSIAKFASDYGHITNHLYNCGVMIGRPAVWANIKPLYEDKWPEFSKLFTAYAKTQLLTNWCIASANLTVDVLGFEIHSNGHFPLHEGHRGDKQKQVLYYKDQLVLFKHHIDGQAEQAEYDRLEKLYG